MRLLQVMLLFHLLGAAVWVGGHLIPQLSQGKSKALAFHIVAVTLIAVLFVFVELGFRTGGVF